jgi:CubicO group peptidase (beta-lactamase class C family)
MARDRPVTVSGRRPTTSVQSAKATALRGGDPAQWAAGDSADYFPGAAYRSCWYELRTEPDILLAGGIHGQLIYIDRPRQLVVVKHSRWPEAEDQAAECAAIAASAALARALAD